MNTLGGETMAGIERLDLVSSSKCYLIKALGLKYFAQLSVMLGVADEDRTRNPQSGNLMLHHLSYSDELMSRYSDRS